MFKAMINVIKEETGQQVKQVLQVSLINRDLFFHHGIGPAKTDEAMDFVQSFAGQLYLVETDLGHIMVDYDADDYQLVCPGFSTAFGCLDYLYETAKDLNEDQEETVES